MRHGLVSNKRMYSDHCFRIAPTTWGPVLQDGVQKQDLTVVPYELQLDYDYWLYRMPPQLMTS